MDVLDLSMTQKNVIIDKLAVIIEESRISLMKENKTELMSDVISRKIILLICMVFRLQKQDFFVENRDDILCLNDIKTKLGHMWTTQFLNCDNVKEIRVKETFENMSKICHVVNWDEYLCYALEVLEYDPEVFLSMKIKRGIHSGNEKKKNLGIYYTPNDVVEFMINKCLSDTHNVIDKRKFTILDCSCGTGVFLIKSLKKLTSGYKSEDDIRIIIENCIWGVDKSEIAVESAKINLMIEYGIMCSNNINYLDEIWSVVNSSIVQGDATNLEQVLKSHIRFPKKYRCLLGNPPYVTEKNKGNLYLSFVKNMMKYGDEKSYSSLIVPLSICYSQAKPFKNVRDEIFNEKNVKWSFYNFDRSPDSLFGDQVKTRNTILFRQRVANNSEYVTTGLRRWTSETRRELFCTFNAVNFDVINWINIIPKISTPEEKKIYDILSKGKMNMNSLTVNKGGYIVYINATAYNWLCVYDHIPPSMDENGNLYIPSSMKKLKVKNEEDKYFVIAMLSNRIAYWYWTVIGDGFHLNTSFFNCFCVDETVFDDMTKNELAQLGREYCDKIKMYSTKTYNCNKCIVNYNHLPLESIYMQIELIIFDRMGLSDEYEKYIEKWYNNQILCGRDKKGTVI